MSIKKVDISGPIVIENLLLEPVGRFTIKVSCKICGTEIKQFVAAMISSLDSFYCPTCKKATKLWVNETEEGSF